MLKADAMKKGKPGTLTPKACFIFLDSPNKKVSPYIGPAIPCARIRRLITAPCMFGELTAALRVRECLHANQAVEQIPIAP